MVVAQAAEGYFGIVPRWNVIVTGLVPFIVFMIAGTAELNRPPFDLVEAEQELVGGFHTEYSSIRFALFFLAEFMNTITMSAHHRHPVLRRTGRPGAGERRWAAVGIAWAWGVVWFFLKLFVLLFCFVWMRATLPRFRYDQLMDLGWKALIPVALGWFLFLAPPWRLAASGAGTRPRSPSCRCWCSPAAALLLVRAVRSGRRSPRPRGRSRSDERSDSG